MQAELVFEPLFRALLSGISDEVYILSAENHRLFYVSDQTLKFHQCSMAELQSLPLEHTLGITPSELRRCCNDQQEWSDKQLVWTVPDFLETGAGVLRLCFMVLGDHSWIIAIRQNAALNQLARQALDESESRFQAIVANTPGLVFQCKLAGKNQLNFIYLSEGCNAVLGVTGEELKAAPGLLYSLMSEEDRQSFSQAVEASVADLTVLNWEGRIWIEAWQDTKWINVRGTPGVLPCGGVQWGGIITNITQSKNEKLEIERSRERMAELSAYLTQVKEQERLRIAREIHDDLGGNLTAIKIGLSSIINRMNPASPALLERARNLETLVDQTFDAAHRIASDLRPDILELGIVEALEWQARQFERQFSLPCRFVSNRPEVAVTSDEAIALYRVSQEAMSNIAKHAQAQHVELRLEVTDDEITLQLIDDGIGIRANDEHKPNSFGLRGMMERVLALEGTLDVSSVMKGTCVTVKIPRTLK